MSKLQALKTAAAKHSGFDPSQPRDEGGRFAAVGKTAQNIATTAAEKAIVAGAGAIGHHVAGEGGAIAAMIAARAGVTLGKQALEARHKEASRSADEAMDEIEQKGMGDVFGHFVAGAVKHAVGAAADAVLPHGGQAIGMAASAAITPQLVKAARSLKSKMAEPPLTPRTA